MTPPRVPRNALAAGALLLALLPRGVPADDQGPFADFVEPDFPFVSTTLDAGVSPAFPAPNVAVRGLVLQLGNGAYAAFDPDLLRMAVGWTGGFMEMGTMAQVSYHEPLNKSNRVPRLLGTPLFANGMYAGWTGERPVFGDPRPPGPNPRDPGRGPLPEAAGRWRGVYVVGGQAVLAYAVGGAEVREQPGSVAVDGEVGISRVFRVGPRSAPLTLVAAEVTGTNGVQLSASAALLYQGAARDTVTAVGVVDAPRGARLLVEEGRYVTLRLPAGSREALFRVVVWRGPVAERGAFARMLRAETRMVEFERGGPAHWPESVATRGVVSPDTAAHVVDRLTLPIPNPWRRNVRAADLDFFSDGRAAVVTFDGDVWIVDGIDRDLASLRWRRFASGLYEPLGVRVVDDVVYVYSRDGLVRPRDLDGDGEADYYESFSNRVHQSVETREFPLSMDARPGGGFYLSKGGALDAGPPLGPAVAPGFRAGSRHAGTVLEVSADGRDVSVFASGLREAFVAASPRTGAVSASDQQGNFVPATPVYLLARGGYYGVAPTAQREAAPPESPPLVWIPHSADRSGAGQVWVPPGALGFEGETLLHLSYGRPGIFRVYGDASTLGRQGAIAPLLRGYTDPLLKGRHNPRDGHLYLAGFRIWDSNAAEVSALGRVRRTSLPGRLPASVEAGSQGIVLRFDAPLDPAAARDAGRYSVQRWGYRRTSAYGSGNYRADGTPGRDTLRVAAAHLSPDARSLLLVVPDMRPAMQIAVGYDLRAADRRPLADTLYLTLHRAEEMGLTRAGFGAVDWRADLARAAAGPAPAVVAASAARGAELHQRVGCAGCHSVDGSTQGRTGPSFRGLYGSLRTFTDGTTRRADEAYLRESIREPARLVVQGYAAGMPSYLGVLGEAEIESLVMYIATL